MTASDRMQSSAVLKSGELPAGVKTRLLSDFVDARGTLTELYRADWEHAPGIAQYNAVRSLARTLRGVHVHVDHADYLTLIEGEMFLGLYDIRAESETCGRGCLLHLRRPPIVAVVIPVGVAHGFYFPVDSTLVYGLSSPWAASDEFGCRFDDPALGLDWPDRDPILSMRDQTAGSAASMRAEFAAARWRVVP